MPLAGSRKRQVHAEHAPCRAKKSQSVRPSSVRSRGRRREIFSQSVSGATPARLVPNRTKKAFHPLLVWSSIVSCDARCQGSMPLAPFRPQASVISTLTTALLGCRKTKRNVMKKRSEDRIHQHPAQPLWLHWNRLLLRYCYAVRYAPDAGHHRGTHFGKSWREQRGAFRPYNDSTDRFL